MTNKRLVVTIVLLGAGIVFAGVAVYFAADGHYTPAASNGLAALIAVIVAHMSVRRGRQSVVVACVFLGAMISFNVLVWTALF